MLEDLHRQYGVCGHLLVPFTTFAMHAGYMWVDRVLRAMGTLGVRLLMLLSVYSCVPAHLPQVQWTRRRWVTRSYTFRGSNICVLSGPHTDAAVRSLTDPANNLLHARLPCHEPGHCAVQLRECHEDHLHLPHTGVGPTQLDHASFTGLQAVFQSRVPGPPTHCLIHPVRRKKVCKRTRQFAAGDAYVVGGYRDDNWDPNNRGPSMPFVPLAALMFLLGDLFDGHKQQDDAASVPLLKPHTGAALTPRLCGSYTGGPRFAGRARRCVGATSGQSSSCCRPAPSRMLMTIWSRRWSE